ncbi:MAG: class II glutamine amidotransferase [Planctomycetaceae bacterium]|nr:class II glutamine amidotransferase [Planctomycetaceae bacterium]
MSAEPRGGEDLLTSAPNCLVRQSCGDHRGKVHHDGWGIGWYEKHVPQTIRSAGPASTESMFCDTARTIRSHLILGHVRQSSVGSLCVENSHPFVWDRWMLAHNGTIEGFEHVAPRMTAEMSTEWLAHRRGTTDSELLFLWLLARAERQGLDLRSAQQDLQPIAQLLRRAVTNLATWSREAPLPPDGEPTRLNLFLTDGESLWVVRWQYDLHYCQQQRQLIVASEPIGEGPWRELPEPSILTVRRGAHALVEPLSA